MFLSLINYLIIYRVKLIKYVPEGSLYLICIKRKFMFELKAQCFFIYQFTEYLVCFDTLDNLVHLQSVYFKYNVFNLQTL